MARRPNGMRNAPRTSSIDGAFDDGRSEVEALRDEISAWKENMENNNMENVPKFEEVSEAADALDSVNDNLQGIEVPSCLVEVEVLYTQDTRQSAGSRAGRMQNALQALGAAKDGAEAWLEENPELEVEVTEEDEDVGEDVGEDAFEDEDATTQEMVDQRESDREAVEQFASDLDDAISEAEGVSFPGMY